MKQANWSSLNIRKDTMSTLKALSMVGDDKISRMVDQLVYSETMKKLSSVDDPVDKAILIKHSRELGERLYGDSAE